MKKALQIFSCLIMLPNSVFCQSNDDKARYLYTKAEENFFKNEIVEGISNCEEAISLLGKPNRKILMLMFSGYDNLLSNGMCLCSKLKETQKINSYLNFFFQGINLDNYPKDKFDLAMKFKDDYAKYLNEGCPSVSKYSILDLGIEFDVGTRRVSQINDGQVKSQTDIKKSFLIYPDRYDSIRTGYQDIFKKITTDLQLAQKSALDNCSEEFEYILYVTKDAFSVAKQYRLVLPSIKK